MAQMRDDRFLEMIGRQTREKRVEAQLSLEELARRGLLPSSTLSRLESGLSVPLPVVRRVAHALGIPPHELLEPRKKPEYHSVFLSYGGLETGFAKRIHRWLQGHGVNCFFFPESATPGVRLHRTMSEGIELHDRVILLCSKHSLTRSGVLYELEQVLSKEAAQGGRELLIPVALDGFMFKGWQPERTDLARQVCGRVVADFRNVRRNSDNFEREMNRLLGALAKQPQDAK